MHQKTCPILSSTESGASRRGACAPLPPATSCLWSPLCLTHPLQTADPRLVPAPLTHPWQGCRPHLCNFPRSLTPTTDPRLCTGPQLPAPPLPEGPGSWRPCPYFSFNPLSPPAITSLLCPLMYPTLALPPALGFIFPQTLCYSLMCSDGCQYIVMKTSPERSLEFCGFGARKCGSGKTWI